MKPTPTQLEILRLLSEGLLLKQIAYWRGNHYNTMKTHMHDILRRVGARTSTHAVAIAIRRGWL